MHVCIFLKYTTDKRKIIQPDSIDTGSSEVK